MTDYLTGLVGIPLNIRDRQALSKDEVAQRQMAQSLAMRAAPNWGWPDLAMSNALWSSSIGMDRADRRPLDERFADFKRRLAAAIEARKSTRNL